MLVGLYFKRQPTLIVHAHALPDGSVPVCMADGSGAQMVACIATPQSQTLAKSTAFLCGFQYNLRYIQ